MRRSFLEMYSGLKPVRLDSFAVIFFLSSAVSKLPLNKAAAYSVKTKFLEASMAFVRSPCSSGCNFLWYQAAAV